jgi:protein-disulfide isomerase
VVAAAAAYFMSIAIIFAMLILPSPPAAAVQASTITEDAVLEVIANHPEAIVQALETYDRQWRESQERETQQVLGRIAENPIAFIGDSPIRGDRHAKSWLIEFADFECPFCISAHRPVQNLLSQHKEVGFVFKNLPLFEFHPDAVPAATAAWAAGRQGMFWEFYDGLFSDAGLGEERYLSLAREIGLNIEQWEVDRTSNSAQQAIGMDLNQAVDLDISGTPSFVVVRDGVASLVVGADIQAIESRLNAT